MVTTCEVIEAFDSLGALVVQAKALQARLVPRNVGHVEEIVNPINTAISIGTLVQTPQGGIRKP
ncbi:MAG: hypothetical protein ACYC9J_11715 [Sulfuricaulis sp.]